MEVRASRTPALHQLSGWRRRVKSLNGWQIASALAAVISLIPLMFILVHLAEPASDTWKHMADYLLLPYITRTLLLMLGTGALTLLLGIPAAWLTASCAFPGRKIIEMLLALPLAIPGYIMAYSYAGLLGSGIMNLAGLSAVLSFALYPYVYMIARSAFLQQSASLREAARSMGLGQGGAFWRISLPMARPAIIGGLALVMMEVINDYGAVKYYGVPTFTAGIFRAWFSMDDLNAAVRLSACLLLVVFALLSLERYQRGAARISEVRTHAPARIQLQGLKAFAALAVCALPVLAGFLLPAVKLLHWNFQADSPDYVNLANALKNTLFLAAAAAALCVCVALLLAWTARISHEQKAHLSVRLATLGYAVPGAVIA
ncbi:MAG: iron ABC transporter permease, partial [Bacteroidetes bacterium]